MKPLVSVVVPIYNVEKYLANCLDSIIAQTYSNLQIILVNDGSLDNSPIICKDYCKKDCRIELVNKDNGGPSSARNVGIKRVKGDYLLCVDADDWIEPNMIEILLRNIIKYNADMSICSFYKCYCECEKKESFSHKIERLSIKESMKKLIMPGNFYGFLWNKLLKTKIVSGLCFDETIIKGEDSLFLCKYLLKSKSTVLEDIPLYHYRVDSVSISRSRFNVGKMSVLKAYEAIIDILKNHNYSNGIIDMQKVQYANQLLSLRTNIVLSDKKKFAQQRCDIDRQMKSYEDLYIKSKLADVKHKFAYILAVHNKFLFNLFCKIYKG